MKTRELGDRLLTPALTSLGHLLAFWAGAFDSGADSGVTQPTRRVSWWPLEPRTKSLAIVAVLAGALFAASWLLLGWLASHGFYGNVVISDVGLYQAVGDAVLYGQLPYRDLSLEYPPAALVPFVLSSLLTQPAGDRAAYDSIFEALMLACGVISSMLVVFTGWRLRWPVGHVALSGTLVAISPLLIGPVILSRFDLWPAVLVAGSMAAIVGGRVRLGSALLAAAVLAKVYPLVLAPLLVAYVWRTRGRREAGICILIGTATGLLVSLPFLVLAPAGIADSLWRAIARPLQVESLGASLIFVGHWLVGTPVEVVTNFGSQNLAGALPEAMVVVQTVALAAILLAVWAWFARGVVSRERLLVASAVAVSAYVAFGKVLSPQYLIWLVPVVVLAIHRRTAWTAAAFVLALVLTSTYFPRRYFEYVQVVDAGAAVLVFARNLSLVGLVAALAVPWSYVAERTRAVYAAVDRRIGLRSLLPDAQLGLLLLLLGAFLLRTLWLNLPAGSLIFDETYYVNAARVMLGIHPPAGMPYIDATLFLDPNSEHPPLGKALIAASMAVFGDNAIGWRLPSVIAGMVALLAVYGIVRALGGRRSLALLAMALYSLDVLSFVHGRIGTLDMLSLAFILAGAFLALRRRWVLAGSLLALGTLVKVPGLYGFVAVIAWLALGAWFTYRRTRHVGWQELRPVATVTAAYAVVGLVGLWLLDLRFTTYTTPFEHIGRMLGYGLSLQPAFNPSGITSAPWQWLVNDGQFDYLRVAVNTLLNGEVIGSRVTVEFRAVMNPILIGSAALATLFAARLAIKRGEPVAMWALIWIAANYLPYVVLTILANRITYFYYVLPSIPGLALLIAVLLVHGRFGRRIAWAYVGVAIVGFMASFPFRELP